MEVEQDKASGRHMTPQDLAERLGVPVSSLYGWRAQRKGPPAMRVGKHVRYRLIDVLAWEQTQIDLDAA